MLLQAKKITARRYVYDSNLGVVARVNFRNFELFSFVLGGLYGSDSDSYREAATQRELLPREMQSITWEAVRALFSPEFKRLKGAKEKVNGI